MSITEIGYRRLTYEEILSDLTLEAQELFGEDIDVSDETPLGKYLNILAHREAKNHELAELIYYASYPNTATGNNLDRLCPMVMITRNVATPARYTATVTGEAGTHIPIGFLVSTESGLQFYNITDATIPDGETTCTITVECVSAGTIGNVIPSDICEIVNPEAGIDSITGEGVEAKGDDEESDYELRKRFLAAAKGSGTGNIASVIGAILRVPTVSNVAIVENDTDTVDSYGNPPHSMTCYVAGGFGYEQEIGEAIFSAKPIGIGTNGAISVTVVDGSGVSHPIYYNTIQNVEVVVEISIETTDGYEGDLGITTIKNNIEEQINSLDIGDDVILTSLYGHIYSVKGVARVVSLTLNGTANDISISSLQTAVCSAVNVTEV